MRRSNPSFLAQAGSLDGFQDMQRGVVTEIQPFVTGNSNGAIVSTGEFAREPLNGSAGLNARLGFTNLSLDATLNPDFSQVESDAGLVTINERFALSYPEKRPFFLEGADVFNFGQLRRNNDYGGMTFFYTRRVGRAPTRFPSGGDIEYVDMPEQTTIAGAAKVTGRVGPWTDVHACGGTGK